MTTTISPIYPSILVPSYPRVSYSLLIVHWRSVYSPSTSFPSPLKGLFVLCRTRTPVVEEPFLNFTTSNWKESPVPVRSYHSTFYRRKLGIHWKETPVIWLFPFNGILSYVHWSHTVYTGRVYDRSVTCTSLIGCRTVPPPCSPSLPFSVFYRLDAQDSVVSPSHDLKTQRTNQGMYTRK